MTKIALEGEVKPRGNQSIYRDQGPLLCRRQGCLDTTKYSLVLNASPVEELDIVVATSVAGTEWKLAASQSHRVGKTRCHEPSDTSVTRKARGELIHGSSAERHYNGLEGIQKHLYRPKSLI